MEYNQKHINELVRLINCALEEKREINDSINFINKAIIVFIFCSLVSFGVTINPGTFEYGIVFDLASAFSISWGIYNHKKLTDLYNESHRILCNLVNEKHEYTLEYRKMLEEKQRLEQEKEEQIRLNNIKDKLIQNAINIKPELRLEWLSLLLRVANNEVLFNNILNSFNRVSQNDFNISDLYFNLDGKMHSLSTLLIRYSLNGNSYQEYCKENNINLINIDNIIIDKNREYASYNLEYIQREKELEWVNLVDDLIKNKQSIFLNVLMTNLRKCQEEDFINISDMYVYYNNHGYSIIDLLIYFSNKSIELVNYQDNKKLSRKKA